MEPKRTYTISNIAGGDAREFTWRGELTSAAIRHADGIGFGGPKFAGDAGQDAADAYDRLCEDRE